MPDSTAPVQEHLYHDDFVRPHRRRPVPSGHRRRNLAAPVADQRCETRPPVSTAPRERPRTDHRAGIRETAADEVGSGVRHPDSPTDPGTALSADRGRVTLLVEVVARLGPRRGRRMVEVLLGRLTRLLGRSAAAGSRGAAADRVSTRLPFIARRRRVGLVALSQPVALDDDRAGTAP
jgi:hypothetical protein